MTKIPGLPILISIILFSVPSFLEAQSLSKSPKLPVDDKTKLITYQDVVDMPSTGFKELQNRAFNWANEYYKNPADVIRERDTVAGKMICKARLKIINEAEKKEEPTEAGLIEYTLTLEFKENKYRYTISEINWKQKSYYPAERWMETDIPGYKPVYVYYLQQSDDHMKKVMKDLDKGMRQPTATIKKDDW